MKTITYTLLLFMLFCQSLFAQSPPANDANKWHITIFTSKNCQYCETLKRDFETPHLSPWKSFAHVNYIDINQASQASRRVAFLVSPKGQVPIILCYPPKNDPVYPYYLVFRQTGYDGDELKLSKALYQQVTDFQRVIAHDPKIEATRIAAAMDAPVEKCIGCRLFHRRPWCPRPSPTPTPDVDVDVDVTPLPLPVIPDITPDTITPDTPDDIVPQPDLSPTTGIPDYPLVTIIYDSQGLGEESRLDNLRRVAMKLIEPFTLLSPKGQILEIGTDRANAFPTKPGDAPSIFVTDRGKILAAINRSTIALLLANQPEPGNDTPTTPVDVDYQKIINAVTSALKNDPALKGADGKDGKDGSTIDAESLKKAILSELPPLTIDYESLNYELIASRLPPITPGDQPDKRRHIVIVADQKASYWPRLSGEIKTAEGFYSAIKTAPPPAFSTPLPQLVVYENGIPVRRSVGLYNVSNDLAQITRGTFPAESAGR